MHYFVTGATGFIGKRLVGKLLERKGAVVYFLVRERSAKRVDELLEHWGVDKTRAVPVHGDLALPGLGITKADRSKLEHKTITHFFHLAAVYDLKADEESQRVANIDGTRNVVAFANDLGAGCFHHASSIAAAGLYEGVFREDMFEEAEEPRPPLLLDQARVGEDRARGVPGAVARLPPGHRRRRLAHRRDGQDRRPVLLLQAYPADAPAPAAVDADDRARGRADQPRAGQLRGRRDRPHRAQEGA